VSTKGWDILHQGAKRDIIGDYDFRNRVYSPTFGRPLQSDQLQFEAGEANFYRWEGNEPNGHLDPSGNRWTFGDVALGAGTAFLIAGGAVLVVGTGGLATPLVVGGAAAVIGGGLAGHYAESSGDAINIGGTTGVAVGAIGAGGVLVARFGVEQAGRIVLGAVGSSLTGTNVDFTKPGVPLSGLPVVTPRNSLYENPSGLVKSRVGELTTAIPDRSKTRITMGVGVVEDANGVRSVLISTSEPRGYLRRGVTLKPGETMVVGTGHAEADIVAYAKADNLKVIDIGATRLVCPPCQDVIGPTGANISTPLKKRPQ
jgi:filamentous hemagglutinin